MYEQPAGIGTLIGLQHLALKEKPDPTAAAMLKQHAKVALEGFPGKRIDTVSFTAQGLALR